MFSGLVFFLIAWVMFEEPLPALAITFFALALLGK